MVDPVLIPAILSLTFQGAIGIISQIQHSRCSSIRMCGAECIRQLPIEEKKEEKIYIEEETQELTDNRIPNTIK